ncbi:Uncharacterized protein TPAR_02259 [Tolypocladium paradoxum]|uniref:Myb-like domain-containing protein n=1 Tax=Tolypocladium paradoxum TaxID=94208 RepID=A0A2S4L522_9HYPO|nr:Uncharacterized protein TPAR_02259 [Tolypocladium paradoxum]
MSDTEVTPGKALPWTDEAKFQFLLRIIAQLRDDGKTMNWARINMAGRTTKSLQNMWTKINKEISEIEAAENGENGGTPTKPRPSTPRKGRTKKVEKPSPVNGPCASDSEGETDVKPTPATPRKRTLAARAASNSAAKKIKKAASDCEADAVIKDGSDYESALEI